MNSILRRASRLAFCAALACALAACGGIADMGNSVVGWVPSYKVAVVQGNFISKEQVLALQPGMARQQVADLLGTPLLVSVFHADRWDYAFTMKTQDSEPLSRRLTVYFKGDTLERFEGDEMLTEAEFAAKIAKPKKADAAAPLLEASEDSLKALAPASPKAAAPTAPTPVAPTVYPPLEPALR